MKFDITLNNIKVTRDIPTAWDQVTFGQFIEMSKCGNDYTKIISVLTGIDEEALKKATIKKLDLLMKQITFVNSKPVEYVPKEILGYPVPKDLGFETIGQIEDLKTAVKKANESSNHILNYPLYCAIYACRPYEWQKAEQMKDIFLNAPCLEVLGIGNFTLLKLIELSLGTGINSRKQNTLWKKFKQAMTILRIRLVFMVHCFTWRKRLATNEKNF